MVRQRKRGKKPHIKRCPHEKDMFYCTECDGKDICDHGNRKCRCKECGDAELCNHGKLKKSL